MYIQTGSNDITNVIWNSFKMYFVMVGYNIECEIGKYKIPSNNLTYIESGWILRRL